jgi:hypothetical protein
MALPVLEELLARHQIPTHKSLGEPMAQEQTIAATTSVLQALVKGLALEEPKLSVPTEECHVMVLLNVE